MSDEELREKIARLLSDPDYRDRNLPDIERRAADDTADGHDLAVAILQGLDDLERTVGKGRRGNALRCASRIFGLSTKERRREQAALEVRAKGDGEDAQVARDILSAISEIQGLRIKGLLARKGGSSMGVSSMVSQGKKGCKYAAAIGCGMPILVALIIVGGLVLDFALQLGPEGTLTVVAVFCCCCVVPLGLLATAVGVYLKFFRKKSATKERPKE